MIEVTRAEPSMAPAMAFLHAAGFAEEKWTASQIEETLSAPTTEAYVALDNQAFVGLILCQIVSDEIEILTFCVAPSHRRQGLAQKLLTPFLTRPVSRVFHLEVASDNIPARRLYEKVGFREVGKRPNYYKRGEKTLDGIRYLRNLNATG